MPNFISHVATFEIPVSDLDKSIDFYVDILGVSIEFKNDDQAMLTFNAEGVPTLFLVETKEQKILSFINSYNSVEHSVIDFYTPKLKEFYQWLVGKEVQVGSLNINVNGFGGFGFKDPDGNLLGATNILSPGQ